jgi:hypothetical protein
VAILGEVKQSNDENMPIMNKTKHPTKGEKIV